MKKKYNPTCICKHKHNKHNEKARSANYSAGKCSKCKCEHFIITPNTNLKDK